MPARKPLSCRYPWAHDYARLIREWRKIHRVAGLSMKVYGEAFDYPLYILESRHPDKSRPNMMLSAGIHGDEPAPPVAILEWVTRNPKTVQKLNVVIFPCLNPWGIVNNNRMDAEGRDLNRTYHDDKVLQTLAHRKALANRRFAAALMLHEDYDGKGAYVYEVARKKPFWASKIILAASRFVPVDSRPRIEHRKASKGVIRRDIKLISMPDRPEALHLYYNHAERAFTVETPSEYFLNDRVEAHVAGIQTCATLCLKEHRQ
ncbi:MAG: M14 family metallocarboxypeptidase [Chthoniobacterales bacterium]